MSERSVGMDSILDRLASVAMIVAATTVLWVLLGGRGSEFVAGVEEIDGIVDVPPAVGVRGYADARLAIIEFSDFECPFCGRYARDTYPRLIEEYVDTGKIRYVFRHFPLDSHPLAFRAAEAAECAAREGMYWGMHDLLFAADGALAEVDLLGYAVTLGLQRRDFEMCLERNSMAERVLEDRQYGEALGVRATPTFFFAEVRDDGKLRLLAKLSGARPYTTFQTTLERLLSRN